MPHSTPRAIETIAPISRMTVRAVGDPYAAAMRASRSCVSLTAAPRASAHA
jgi:uncharacterized protein (DUF2342 family)